jgi:hypothetical protein
MEEEKKYKGESLQVHLAQYQPVAASENMDRKGWLKYGDDNAYPSYLKSLSQTSPVHGALVKGIAKMIAGKGIGASNSIDQGKMMAMKVEKVWKAICNDIELYGGCYIERIKTMDLQGIARVEHLPFENCRLWLDENTNVVGVFYSRDWSAINKPLNKPRPIHLAGLNNESSSEVVISFIDECTSSFYPEPSYQSAINYIELDRKISQFHVSSVLNGFFPSTIISLFNGEPDPEKKAAMKSYFNKQTGTENAGQIMLLFNEAGATAPTIESFQLTDADKMYESLAKQATEKIMIGHLVTTPLLFGVRGEGTGFSSNSDELKHGFKIFTENVIEPYRKDALDALSLATGINTFVVTPNSYFTDDVVAEQPKQELKLSSVDMSDEDEDAWLEHLYERGETINEDEWELDEELSGEVKDIETEERIQKEIEAKNQGAVEMYKAYANPDAKSEMDGGIYKVRYGYPTRYSDNSRRFCKAMAQAASGGIIYRYEDIVRMGDEGVNSGFAASGESTYSIFLYKGGANCHHYWTRKVYRRKRDAKGKILKNDGLNNEERVTQSQANKAGFDFKDSSYWAKASTRPIDMPNHGYKNPR